MLSIIIPVYNVENYIEETLLSIFKANSIMVEVIIVDDGSKDGSIKIIEGLSNKFQIKILRQKNSGVSSARNAGLKAAQGEYIMFLDGDDVIGDNLLNNLGEILKFNSDIIIGNRSFFNNKTKELKKVDSIYDSFYSEKEKFLENCISNNIVFWNIGGYIVKRKILLDNNIFFNESLSSAEDLDFFMRILISSKLIMTSQLQFFTYRLFRENSIMNSPSMKKIADDLNIFKKFYSDYDENICISDFFLSAYSKSISNIGYLKNSYEIEFIKNIILIDDIWYSSKKIKIKIYIIIWKIMGIYKGSKLINTIKRRL
ncbi:glycosyltransferase family 2 protein [Enterococcus casseliflavus]|uniref:glycosyltransferase family 2 protein n=1 Tax=Enterococcus casseliflavus TaxID=37734 RepID=UPI002953D94C|nr:glycosyltransferase family 2 protein [Enterococcus casseliflavus]MDV7751302.1 glycosyltransferase family 2 protein [Enterococcus casseliflavus]